MRECGLEMPKTVKNPKHITQNSIPKPKTKTQNYNELLSSVKFFFIFWKLCKNLKIFDKFN